MPRNIFADPMGGLRDGYEAAESITQDIRRKYAGARAAPRIAAGDYGGAAEDFAAMGMVDEARDLRGDAMKLEQQQYERGQAQQQIDRETGERNLQLLDRVATALEDVPEGQRKAALQQIYPVFQQAKIDTSALDGLDEAQLTTANLRLFRDEIKKQFQGVNLGAGGYGVFNPETGDFKTLREPDPRLQAVADGAVLIDPRTRQVVADNPKNFAPKSGGSGGLPPPPTGWTPVR